MSLRNGGHALDEAKTRLIQRYERRLKHLLDVTPEEI